MHGHCRLFVAEDMEMRAMDDKTPRDLANVRHHKYLLQSSVKERVSEVIMWDEGS